MTRKERIIPGPLVLKYPIESFTLLRRDQLSILSNTDPDLHGFLYSVLPYSKVATSTESGVPSNM